jgi:hypothetical protein
MKVISGGQTGVDRAALDVALELGIECGGFCPKGRRAEDGAIPDRYPLRELATRSYPARTERNIREADATLILHRGAPGGGTALTQRLARTLGRPLLLVDLSLPVEAAAIPDFLRASRISTLNVAGPRESEAPGIHDQAAAVLRRALSPWAAGRRRP